jgi:acetyl-CoA acetyltransferase
MRDVAVVAFAQSHHVRRESLHNEVEMVMPVLHQVKADVGLDQSGIDFTCSGSTDYLAGSAFSFVITLDGVGAFPPIAESHVEMDGAWALYEAWVKIQTGAADTALVYGYGKSSPGELRDVLSRQLDPYYVAPLWPDSLALAALQARACLDAGVTSTAEMADVAARSRRAASGNPFAQLQGSDDPAVLLKEPELAAPLRRHDCPPITDGAAAVILAAGDRARELSENPAWITGIDHRVEAHSLGVRDLADSPSTRIAGERAGVHTGGPVDVAELHAPFTHQEVLLREALGLGDGADTRTDVNPSGGALAANPMMAAGLIRIGEAAQRIQRGEAGRAVAHATSGPCLQQNLVCVLDGEPGSTSGSERGEG